MIHTDGKPTIANTRLTAATDPNLLRKYPELEWETCPCAECSERCPVCGETGYSNPAECNYCQSENPDPDSAPDGYDNPREPYDWNGEDA